jgi:iron complex outermembrane recepter protein
VFGNEADDEMDAELLGGVLKINHDLGWGTFVSNTGYEGFRRDFADPNDGSPLPLVTQLFDETQYTFQQEFRVSSKQGKDLTWIAGVNYSYEEIDWTKVVPFLLARTEVATAYNKTGHGAAIFGQLDYKFSERWKVILGARLLRDDRDITWSVSEDRDPYGTTTLTALTDLPIVNLERSIVENKFLWKAGLNWTPTDDVLLYTLITTGFKSGGFDGSFIGSLPETEPFKGEDVTAYEFGYKTTWFDNTVNISGSFFNYDYEQIQATRIVTRPGGGTTGVLDTAGDANIKGADLQFDWFPVPDLRINLGATYLGTEILSFISDDPTQVTAALGNSLPGSPEYKLNGLLSYGMPAFGNRLEMTLEFQSQSAFNTELQDKPLLEVDDYTTVNARVDFASHNESWTVGLWVRNLTDAEYAISKFPEQGQSNVARQIFAPPRTFGLYLKMQF